MSDSITFLMILDSTHTSLFSGNIYVISVVLIDFEPRKKYPPYLICASGSEMEYDSEYICGNILLLLYSVNSSVCEAL